MPRVSAKDVQKRIRDGSATSVTFGLSDRLYLESMMPKAPKVVKADIIKAVEQYMSFCVTFGTGPIAPLPSDHRTVYKPLLRMATELRIQIEETPTYFFRLPLTRHLNLMQDAATRERMINDGLTTPQTIVDHLRTFEAAISGALARYGVGDGRGQRKHSNKIYAVWQMLFVLRQVTTDFRQQRNFIHRALRAARLIRKQNTLVDERATVTRLIRQAKKEHDE